MAIAHHVAKRKFTLQNKTNTFCEHYDRHSFHKQKKFAKQRDPRNSRLWTFVRHPAARDISELYHFHVTRRYKDPNNDTEYLLRRLMGFKGKQTRYLALRANDTDVEIDSEYEIRLSTSLRTKLFEKYDFIGLVERMMESLAILTLLWDLDPTDVIVLSSKHANGDGYDGGGYKKTCFKMESPP